MHAKKKKKEKPILSLPFLPSKNKWKGKKEPNFKKWAKNLNRYFS
jgi:hypothetical protein